MVLSVMGIARELAETTHGRNGRNRVVGPDDVSFTTSSHVWSWLCDKSEDAPRSVRCFVVAFFDTRRERTQRAGLMMGGACAREFRNSI